MAAKLRIKQLPEGSLDATDTFHRDYLKQAREKLEGETDRLTIILPAAGSDHDDWRRAMARDLARQYAPKRVNLLGGGSPAAISAMLAYLRAAPGITGQYLPLHD